MRRSRSLTLRTNPSSQEEIKDMPGLPRTSGGKPRKSNSRKGAKLTASVADGSSVNEEPLKVVLDFKKNKIPGPAARALSKDFNLATIHESPTKDKTDVLPGLVEVDDESDDEQPNGGRVDVMEDQRRNISKENQLDENHLVENPMKENTLEENQLEKNPLEEPLKPEDDDQTEAMKVVAGIKVASTPGELAVFVPASQLGKQTHLLDEHGHRMKKYKPSTGSTLYRCIKCDKPPRGVGCDAKARVSLGEPVIYLEAWGEHKHESQEEQVVTTVLAHRSLQKVAGTEFDVKSRAAVNQFFKNVDLVTRESGLELAPSFNKDTHARAIRRLKQSNALYPEDPKLPGLIMPMLEEKVPQLKDDLLGNNWLRLCAPLQGSNEVGDETPVVMVFMSDSAIQRLKLAKMWYGDGTFGIVSNSHFKQLYTVHTSNESGAVFPAAYALLPAKSTACYSMMWETIFEQTQKYEGPESFVQDMEFAVRNSLLGIATADIQVIFCWFHLRAAWRRAYERSGLKKLDAGKSFYKAASGLPFVPSYDILAVYSEVVLPLLDPLKNKEGELPTSAKDFSQYLEATYIGQIVDGRFKQPTVDPSQWSHHKHLADDKPLTDNKVEGWHNGVQGMLGAGASVWKVIDTLREEESKTRQAWEKDLATKPQVSPHTSPEGDARQKKAKNKYCNLQQLTRNYAAYDGCRLKYLFTAHATVKSIVDT